MTKRLDHWLLVLLAGLRKWIAYHHTFIEVFVGGQRVFGYFAQKSVMGNMSSNFVGAPSIRASPRVH